MTKRRYRLRKRRHDWIACDAATDEPLGFFVPPRDRAHIPEELSVADVVSRDDVAELEGAEVFGILPHSMGPWLQLGFTFEEALDWRDDARYRRPEGAKPWHAAGFTPQEAREWNRVLVGPVRSAESAAALRDAGVAPKDLQLWRSVGKVAQRDVARWAAAGFHVRQVAPRGQVPLTITVAAQPTAEITRALPAVVRLGGDADTIGSLVGQLLGLRHGAATIEAASQTERCRRRRTGGPGSRRRDRRAARLLCANRGNRQGLETWSR